jgi:hypothetical protein
MLPRRTAAALCALAAVIAIAGCGSSSSGVTPTAYVSAICKAVGPFEKDVATRESALNPSSIKSAAQGKTALIGFLQGVAGDTQHTLAQLKSAGTPNVTNGKKIQGAIVSAFTRLESSMKTGATTAQSLPTSSAKAFQTGATQLSTTIRSSLTGVGSSLQSLRSAKLEKAATKSAACKSITG